MHSDDLPRDSVFRHLVDNIKTDIGVSALVFHVDTETGREFKYLDAIADTTNPKGRVDGTGRARRQSRLDMQMNEARSTGVLRTRQNSVAFLDSSAGVKQVTTGHQSTIDRFGASTMFQSNTAESKEAKRRMRARKKKERLQRGEDFLREDLRMFPPVHKMLPISLLRKFDSEQTDLAPRRRARPKVLIVDGNRIHLGACQAIYTKYFEIVQCVPTADQAMDLLDHVVFDIVLIAPDLPGELSGLDLVDAIRHVEEKSRHVFRSLIIAVLTPLQSRDQALLDACFCSGMDRFLVKPAILYVHLLCDLMVGGTSSDAFRRLALETQWVSNHDAMVHVLGDDPNACSGIMRILDAVGTEEIRQREVAALMDTDTDRNLVDGLHERQRREELQRIVNATAQMKRRIVELEHDVDVLEEERARRAYNESRNLHTLLALEARLKEAERELHEKTREAQQHKSKAEDYRVDLKNLLDNGCVNAEQVAKAKKKVRHFQKIVEACEATAMSQLDASDQRKWSNYYGDAGHRSHFEVEEYVPKFATDASASWYRSELTFLGKGVDTVVRGVERTLEDLKSKVYRSIDVDTLDREALSNVIRDQLVCAGRSFANEISSLKRTVGDTVANLLLRELQFWKLLEDDEPRLLHELGLIKSYVEGLRAHLHDRSHSTQTETFLWDQQTMKDLESIAQEMMSVKEADAGLSILMEASYPRLPDGSYSAKRHAQVELFKLPVHIQQGIAASPGLQALIPLLPLVRGDVFLQEKSRRIIFGTVFDRLQHLLSTEHADKQSVLDRIRNAIRGLRGSKGAPSDAFDGESATDLGDILVGMATDAAEKIETLERMASKCSRGCSPIEIVTPSPCISGTSTPARGRPNQNSTASKKPPTPQTPVPASKASSSSSSTVQPPLKRDTASTPSKRRISNDSKQSSVASPSLPMKNSGPSKAGTSEVKHVPPVEQARSPASPYTVGLSYTPPHTQESLHIPEQGRNSVSSAASRGPEQHSLATVSEQSLELDPPQDNVLVSASISVPSNGDLEQALEAVRQLTQEVDSLYARELLWNNRVEIVTSQIGEALLQTQSEAERLLLEYLSFVQQLITGHFGVILDHHNEIQREMQNVHQGAIESVDHALESNEFRTQAHETVKIANRMQTRLSEEPLRASTPAASALNTERHEVQEPLHSLRKRSLQQRRSLFTVAVARDSDASPGGTVSLHIGNDKQSYVESSSGGKVPKPKTVETRPTPSSSSSPADLARTPSVQMSSYSRSSFSPTPPALQRNARHETDTSILNTEAPRPQPNNAAPAAHTATPQLPQPLQEDHFLPLLPGRETTLQDRTRQGVTRVFQGLLIDPVHPRDNEAESTILMTTSFQTKKTITESHRRERALADAFSRYQQPVESSAPSLSDDPPSPAKNPTNAVYKPRQAPKLQSTVAPPSPMLHVGNGLPRGPPSSNSPARCHAHRAPRDLTRIATPADPTPQKTPPAKQTSTAHSDKARSFRHEKLAELMS